MALPAGTNSFGDGVWQQEAMEVARNAAEALPTSAHAVMLAVLIAGLVMLFVGRRFLKGVFVAAGAVGAMAAGYFGPASLGMNLDPLITGLVMGVLGALVGIAAFRMTVAVVLAAVLALGGPVITASLTGVTVPTPSVQESMGPLSPEQMLLDGVPLGPVEDDSAEARAERERKAAERVRVFVRGLLDELARYWNALPRNTRMTLFWSSVFGALIGFAAGIVLPRRAAAVVTGVLGAGLMVVAGGWFAFANGIMLPGATPENGGIPSPRFIALVWVVLAAVGIGMQWTKKAAKADND